MFALLPFVTDDGDRDGVPNVLVEAMACGVPVVATAAGGVPELVRHGENGLLAAPHDITAVAGHLATLLADPELRRRLGAAARRHVAAAYDVRAAATAARRPVRRHRPTRRTRPGTRAMRLPAELAATAPELTRVAQLLRPAAVALAGAALPTDHRGACHVLDAKYRPGEQCTVLYRVGRTLITARLRLDGSEPVPQWWRFPDDPALPGLKVLTDPDALTGALDGALGGAGGRQRPELRGAVATLLRYRPHRRATFLVRAWSGRRCVRFVAKAYHDAGKAGAVFAATRRLGSRLDTDSARCGTAGSVTLAEPVAFLPGPRLVLQREVPGRPLDQLLGDRRGAGADLPDALARAGTALAAVHAAPPVSDRERAVTGELAKLRSRAAAVAAVRPGLGADLLAVCAELERRAADLPPIRGLVHGDGKPSQFLLDRAGGTIALLDFDHCGLADPASDVGTFLAALRHRAALGAPRSLSSCPPRSSAATRIAPAPGS